jgi:uroporphyrinogen decarboxylase
MDRNHSPRDRALAALDHRVPVFITITPQVAAALGRHLGAARYTVADSPLSANRISFTVRRFGGRFAVCGDLECTIFEGAWHLTGFEKLMVDLGGEKEYTGVLLDRMMEYSIEVGRNLIRRGADMIWLGDDVGMQSGMLISPALWRRACKERLRTVIGALKAENPRIRIAYHSCGSCFPIIPELIEVGVQVLNALQPRAKDMELGRLKRLYGDRVCLFGGLDIQEVLPFGTPERVESEVRRAIDAAAAGGGYILAGAHNIQPDTSIQTLQAVYRLARKYGRYPLHAGGG